MSSKGQFKVKKTIIHNGEPIDGFTHLYSPFIFRDIHGRLYYNITIMGRKKYEGHTNTIWYDKWFRNDEMKQVDDYWNVEPKEKSERNSCVLF